MEDAFHQRERWLEEKYFHQLEWELIQKIRRRRELQEATGTADEEILNDLEQMGYTRETVKYLLPLIPLVQVAWAEGFVTPRERERILTLARERGVTPDSAVFRQLVSLLEERPTDEFFHRTLRIISHLLHTEPPANREADKRELLDYCRRIAEASGDMLELWHTVSDAERATLREIAAELEQ